MTNIIKSGKTKIIAGIIATVTMLTSCGGTQTPSTAATLGSMATTQQTTAPAAPELRVVTTPQTLKTAGSVFFFIASQDRSGKGLSRTEVFVDGERLTDDPQHYNSYGKYFNATANGDHKVRVVVTDALGVSTSVEQDFSVNIAK